jgi:hypothetical protein
MGLPEQAGIGINDFPLDLGLFCNWEISNFHINIIIVHAGICIANSIIYPIHEPGRFVAAESGIEFNRNPWILKNWNG